MRRFFGSSAVVRRIPPAAPRLVKQIPIPRTAKNTEDVVRALGHEIAPPAEFGSDPRLLADVMPRTVTVQDLTQPEGVWYSIERTKSGNLPVYLDYNNAGGVWTEIRKISGSAGALRNDLKISLDLNKKDIWVKNAANTVVIKGDHRNRVKSLLRQYIE